MLSYCSKNVLLKIELENNDEINTAEIKKYFSSTSWRRM